MIEQSTAKHHTVKNIEAFLYSREATPGKTMLEDEASTQWQEQKAIFESATRMVFQNAESCSIFVPIRARMQTRK